MSVRDYVNMVKLVWLAPGNKGRKIKAFRSAWRWCKHVHFGQGDLEIQLYQKYRFICRKGSYMAKHVHYFSEFPDYNEMHFIDQWLRAGDNFLDVGANAGLYMLLAASRVQAGNIVCVEPHPVNLQLLRENIAINNLTNVQVLDVAAGDEVATMTLVGDDAIAGLANHSDGRQVSVVRLDNHLPLEHFTILKIDIEGFEWPALRGMQRLLDEGRVDVILFELNGCLIRYGYTETEFCNWFTSRGFKLAQYDYKAHELTFQHQPRGDVLAFSESGMKLVKERLPDAVIREASD